MISSNKTAITLIGNGLNKQFDFDFFVFKDSGGNPLLKVFYQDNTGEPQEITSNMTITLNPEQETSPGGSITYPVAGGPIAEGTKITIMRAGEFRQKKNFERYQGFDPKQIEEALDVGTAERQELREQIGRAISAPPGQTAEEYFDEITDLKDAAVVAATSAAEAAAAATQALEQIETTATEEQYGRTILSTDEDIDSGAEGKAVQPKQLKAVRDEMRDKTQDATTLQKGIAMFADPLDMVNRTPDKMISAEHIDYLPIPDIAEKFPTGKTTQHHSYGVIKYNEEKWITEIHGRFTTDGTEPFRLIFDTPVIENSIGMGAVVLEVNATVRIVDTARTYVDLEIVDGTNTAIAATATFTLTADIDASEFPQAPTALAVTVEGTTATLTWEDEYA